MWRAAATVGIWTAISRIAGFSRDILIAATLGVGPIADAFFVALKLPNLFRRLFGEGAFNAAFIPAFSRVLQTQGPAPARHLAATVASVMALGLGLLVLAGEWFMPVLMHGFAPGFAATPARFALAVTLTRITFPYLLLICLAALLSGVLNGLHRFAAAAATPVLFNATLIAAVLTLRRLLPTAGHALAIGVVAAGVLQLGLLAWACTRAGFSPTLAAPRLTPPVRAVLARMGPGLVGAGVTQLNLAIGVIIASLLPQGTVAVLYYADRVNQLPLGIIGAALGTVLLPALAGDWAANNGQAAADRLNRAGQAACALTLPATFALLILAQPIIAVLFGRGAFGPDAVRHSAAALTVYALGLPAYVAAKLLAPACFARGDTTTPVWIGIAAVGLNVLASLALMHRLGFLAPACGTAAAAWANALGLAWILHRRGMLRPDAALRHAVARIAAAALAMAAALAALRLLLALWLAGPVRMPALAALIGLGAITFAGAAQCLGAIDARALLARLRSRTARL